MTEIRVILPPVASTDMERIRRILETRRWPTGLPLTEREARLLAKNAAKCGLLSGPSASMS